ncbi:hypothetical protein D0962_17925 [Leptolyngbyaceae cyanobacterium CCMR0082]|uniref:Uncharacterized protein n=1 Tax=Adonisia turfae CCMR0082 TaxID=2304604 RepID=A0A6M0S827_9CYAN|nr:hypothetical protein [Adonisia turfae]NEZ64644.1 hypothetical protein [Adonisia turfae CCMR0082]
MTSPRLEFKVSIDVEMSAAFGGYALDLGDEYVSTGANSIVPRIEWQVGSNAVPQLERDRLKNLLDLYHGWIAFQWQPYDGWPLALVICKNYEFEELRGEPNPLYNFSATFIEEPGGSCEELRAELDPSLMLDMLDGIDDHLTRFTRDQAPFLINNDGVSINSFHEVLGRGGYFPATAGTTEGQAVGVRSAIKAYRITGAQSWLDRAVLLAEAIEDYYYVVPPPPAGGDAFDYFYVPHWLINARGSFPTKGIQRDPPISNGRFGEIFTFANGIATIPGGLLADVYKVYSTDGLLLWPYVYSPLIQGTEYAVNYWVSDLLLEGDRFRIAPDYIQPGGTPLVPTTEAAGKIVLASNYSGPAIVVYSDYSGPTVGVNEKFEPSPLLRPVGAAESFAAFDVFPWLSEAYDLLFEETGNAKWARARDATIGTAITTATVPNISYFYKKEPFYDIPLRWPGSQVFWIFNNNEGTIGRINGGVRDQWLRIVTNTPDQAFASMEVQNFATIVQLYDYGTISIEVVCSVDAILEIVLSASTDAFDQSQLYKVFMVAQANVPITRTFNAWDFARYGYGFEVGDYRAGGEQYLVWHPRLADNPVYLYSDSDPDTISESELVEVTAPSVPGSSQISNGLAVRLTLRKTIFAGAGLVLLQNDGRSLGGATNQPPQLYVRVQGGVVTCFITDADDDKYSRDISPSPNWQLIPAGWVHYVGGTDAVNSQQIKGIEFEPDDDNQTVTVDVLWAGEVPLERIPLPLIIYKGSFVSRVQAAHTIEIGDFKPNNNPFDELPYTPGIWPFTVNTDNGLVEAYRGSPYAAYQSPSFWIKQGNNEAADNVIQFLSDAQTAYFQQHPTGRTGLFAPVLNWASWDTMAVSQEQINKFSWIGEDPNTQWIGYTARTVVEAAYSWYLRPGDAIAQTVAMRALQFLNNDYYLRGQVRPLTDILPAADPVSLYEEPHASALIMKAAIYANLAGGDPTVTWPIIIHTWRHLKSQYIDTISDPMRGSFTAGQPAFQSGGTTYRENFAFWVFEQIEAIVLLYESRSELTIPPCGLTYLGTP